MSLIFHCGNLLRLDSATESWTWNRNLMKKAVLLFILAVLSLNFLLSKALNAQSVFVSENEFLELKEIFDYLNGPDYNLLNGRLSDFPYSIDSHPYFNTDSYRRGSLLLNGEAYDNVLINYDIYDQQVILQLPDWISGLNNKLVLNRELIDYFEIDGHTFRLISSPETGTSFFQVISTGEISCYLHWTKNLYRSSTSVNARYKYLKQSRRIYLQKGDQLFLVKNKSSFTRIFDEAYQEEIKGYLRREKIRFRNESDEKLGDLMDFCAGLINGG